MATLSHSEVTVGQLVSQTPSLSKVFEKLGIDYCCGGKKTLKEVCEKKGLDLETVQAMLSAVESSLNGSSGGPGFDVVNAGLGALADHINSVHHQYLYQAMPRLEQMVTKVARVHGENDSRLAQLRDTFITLKTELELHMAKEENVLFPFCRELEHATEPPRFHCGSIANPIRVMESEHETAGRLLEEMRSLSDGYTPPDWACNTYRALLDGLAEMERDLHEHIHKENNILFPRALEKAAAIGS